MTNAIRADFAAARWAKMEGNDPGDEADIEDFLELARAEAIISSLPKDIDLMALLEAFRFGR